MKKNKLWLKKTSETVTPVKHMLATLSIIVRNDQYKVFKRITHPKFTSKVLDVGVTSDETLKDSNLFEKNYEHKENLTAATIEDVKKFRKLYPNIKSVKIYPKKRLPFKDNAFDIVTAWATVEHVGSYKDQAFFINELLRVGKKVYLTTPYRACFYEPHTGIFFLHWLPLKFFRYMCKFIGKDYWSTEENLNPLYVKNIIEMKLKRKVKIKIYSTLGLLPTHLIIHN